jgi:hypothetical protein
MRFYDNLTIIGDTDIIVAKSVLWYLIVKTY